MVCLSLYGFNCYDANNHEIAGARGPKDVLVAKSDTCRV